MAHHVELSHVSGEHFQVLQDGHQLQLDTAVANDGTDAGPRPKALMLSALAGCTAMDVVSLLNKMRVPFSDFSIVVEGELSDEPPRIYKRVKVQYNIHLMQEAQRENMQRAIDLSREKYCGVMAMFSHFAELQLEVNYL